MVQVLDWTAVVAALMSLLGCCAWFVEGRKHKPTAKGLATDNKLKEMELEIPTDLKVASFYDSKLLGNYKPQITALKYDPTELGKKACETLMAVINGEKVENRQLLSYEVLLKGSTQ